MARQKTKLCFVAASPFTVNVFLRGHLSALSEDFDVTVITSTQDKLAALRLPPTIRVLHLEIVRQPAPLADLLALFHLWQLIQGEGFTVVFTITPKTGLLGMLAACMARVPNRFHYFTGQVWATRTGWRRVLLKACDRLIVSLATRVSTDGYAQMRFLVEQKVVAAERIGVIGPGPICGVDLERFTPSEHNRTVVRKALEIPSDAVVALYLGRLHPEKGIAELSQAFSEIVRNGQAEKLILLLVGPSDDDNTSRALEGLDSEIKRKMRMRGGVPDPERYMAAADFLVLPSYREGFPMVVLEAAAVGLPAIVTDIYGFGDAVEADITAVKVSPRNAEQLKMAMLRLVKEEDLRKRMGAAAIARVKEKYSAASVTQAWLEFYRPLAERVAPCQA